MDQIARLLVENDLADTAQKIEGEDNVIGFTTEAGDEYFLTVDLA